MRADPPEVVSAVAPELTGTWPEGLGEADIPHVLARAIWTMRCGEMADALVAHADSLPQTEAGLVRKAKAAGDAIVAHNEAVARAVIELLQAAGLTVISHHSPPQVPALNVHVDATSGPNARAVLERAGYPIEGGATGQHAVLVGLDPQGTRIALRWGAESRTGSRIRAALRRVRGDRDADTFLATPEDLVLPLLDTAGVGPDDVLLDLGCGDGRVAAIAAARMGCRAIGVERRPDLAAVARARVEADGLSDRVTIHEADFTETGTDEATVVFAFLPLTVLRDLLPSLRSRLGPGSRVLAHEQRPLDLRKADRPHRSLPVFGDASMTVAHLWEV